MFAKPIKAGKCKQVCAYSLSDHSLYNVRNFNHLARLGRNSLSSFIEAVTCMRVNMNSAVLMRENVAEKYIPVCKKRIDLTTITDRPLDNHVVYIRIS